MARSIRVAAVVALVALIGAGPCSEATSPTEDPLVITLPNINLNCVPTQSFAKQCDGTATLNFSKAPASGTSYFVVLNAGNINGSASSTGTTQLQIPIGGQTLSCPFGNPSNLIVYQGTAPSGTSIASLNFQWSSGTLCTNW